jgi:predicted GNAT family N-acyltransferase
MRNGRNIGSDLALDDKSLILPQMHGQQPNQAVPAALMNSELLRSLCRHARFAPGDVLRRKGQHYTEMFLLTNGRVDIDRETCGATRHTVRDAGSPIGEVCFLHGRPALATVTARTAVEALFIDDATLGRLEREQPALTADLMRCLAEIADERTSFNLVMTASAAYAGSRAIEVFLCRNKEMLESAQRLRYEVYCRELGRQSPYADHDRKIIADELDRVGQTFVAIEDGETIGTLRGNRSADGSVGALEELYGMRASACDPHETAVCTKFIVKRSKRGGAASIKLISALVRYGLRHDVKECYIDSIPALVPYYKAVGFTIAGPKFLHRENGPSYPMMIDLVRHGERLSRAAGLRDYLRLMVKAQAFRLVEGWRRPADVAASREGTGS